MRYSGRWMSIVDDRVLEFLAENETGTPTQMKREGKIRYTPEHVARRCRELDDKGLIVNLGNSVYSITEEGEAYLQGELDTDELEADDQEQEADA